MGNIVIVVRGPRGLPDCCQKVNDNFSSFACFICVCAGLPMLTKSVNNLLLYSHVKLKESENGELYIFKCLVDNYGRFYCCKGSFRLL